MRSRIWTVAFLVFLAWPIPQFVSGRPDLATMVLVVAGLAGFIALFLRIVWSTTRRPRNVALMYVLALALAFPLDEFWIFAALFYLISAVAVTFSRRIMFIVCGATVLSAALAVPGLWWIPLQAALFTVAVDGYLRLAGANAALREARGTAERLAIDNERLRFARDLHDILGHSLSVMTLKSQLAGRLLERDPARARAEIAEVENLSRRALDEVRDAVAGYRALSLSEELENAKRMLSDAGVTLEVEAGPQESVPPAAASLLAWVVREGATNTARHSRAARCRIRVGTENGQSYVEVVDDGRGPDGTAAGTGLRGLAERLESAGGSLRGGGSPEGGFVLRAVLPA